MDKGRGNDDAGSEIAGEEVDVEGYVESGNSFGDDGEESGAGGNDEDDEKGGNACAELAIIIVG